MKIKMKVNIKSLLQYILVLLIILASETIWEKMPDKQSRDMFSVFAYGGTAIVLGLLIAIGQHNVKKKSLSRFGLWLLYFFGLILINMVIYKVNVALLFSIPTIMLMCYFLTNDIEITNVMEKFYDVVVCIALPSLVVYIAYVLLKIIDAPTSFPFLRNNWVRSAPSFYLFFYPQGDRNCAFFYEGPKYNVILTLALAYSCYVDKEFITKKNVILALTIISAKSTTGILLMICIIVTKMFFKNDQYKIERKGAVLISPIIVTLAVILFSNLLAEKLNSGSGEVRQLDYIIGYNAWKQNILFGAGFGNNSTIDHAAKLLGRDSLGFSNGLFRILAQGGIYYFLFLAIPLCSFIGNGIRRQKPYGVFLGLVFFGLLFVTSFSATMVYALFITFFATYSSSENEDIT